MMAVMGVKRFCICCVVCALLLSTGIYPQNTGKTTVPPELQEKLDYVKNSNSDCTLEYIDALEEELSSLYSADDYVFFRTNLRRGGLYVLSGDYESGLEYLERAETILKKHTAYDDADAAETEGDFSYIYFLQGNDVKGTEHLGNAISLTRKLYGESSAEMADAYDGIGAAYYIKCDYDKALEYYGKALTIKEKVLGEKNADTAESYNNIGMVYDTKGDYDKALEYFSKALAIRKEALGEKNSDTAISYNGIGLVYTNKGDYDKALEYFSRALAIQKEVLGENHQDTVTSYNNIGLIYGVKNDYDKALEYYSKALTFTESLAGLNSAITAGCYANIGDIYHSKAEYDKALEYYEKALSIEKNVLGEGHINTAKTCMLIGNVYADKDDYDKALDFHRKALSIQEKALGENHQDTAMSYNNIGAVYYAKGDYDKALEYYGKALEAQKEILDEKHPAIATAYNNIGLIYSYKGDYDKALEYNIRALAISSEVFGENHTATATDYHNIGFVYQLKGDGDKALEYYEKALAIWENAFGEQHLDIVKVCNQIALIYNDSKQDYGKALEYLNRALAVQKRILGEKSSGTTVIYDSIGWVHYCMGDYDNALAYYGKALKISKDLLGETHPYTTTDYCNIGKVYAARGELEPTVANWRQAQKGMRSSTAYKDIIAEQKNMLFSNPPEKAFLRDTLSLAMDTVEKARLDMSSMKDELLKNALPIYYYGVDFAAKDKAPAKSFEYSEALRSRGFLDQMGTEVALRLDGVTDGDRKRVQELVSRISVARTELERQGSLTKQERDEARYKKAGDELARAEKELALLDKEIGERVPAYTQLRNPQPVSIKQAQDWCGKRRAVLEYVLWSPDGAGGADIGSYCIVLTQKGVSAVRLDGDFDYATCIERLRKQLTKTGRRVAESRFEQERNDLYARLIAPVLSKLSGIEELVIVPDGSLSLLPFDILRPTADAGCLGDKYAVSFSPSVSVSVIADTHKKRQESVIAFGGAWYDKNLNIGEHRRALRGSGTRGTSKGTDRGSLVTDFELTAANEAQLASMRNHIREYGPGDYFAKLTWQDLPGTVAELDTLREYVFPPGSYDERMQKSASEAELKKLSSSGKLKDYSVLHLACHGYFDRNIADMSSVLFSEVSGKLRGRSQDDGYLTIPETAVLSLDADMVCLSACETGLGEVKRGDGMVGLSRAFMVAGADRVGVSLWCIDDEATAEFMTLMYQKVRQEGKTYSRAYREVKAEFRKSEGFDHPYKWAAFVLYE